eukprot:scaffold22869_cov17-Tisochrysis_lutea.AAC.1
MLCDYAFVSMPVHSHHKKNAPARSPYGRLLACCCEQEPPPGPTGSLQYSIGLAAANQRYIKGRGHVEGGEWFQVKSGGQCHCYSWWAGRHACLAAPACKYKSNCLLVC